MKFQPHETWISGGKADDDHLSIIEKFEADGDSPEIWAWSVMLDSTPVDEDNRFNMCLMAASAASRELAEKACVEVFDAHTNGTFHAWLATYAAEQQQ